MGAASTPGRTRKKQEEIIRTDQAEGGKAVKRPVHVVRLTNLSSWADVGDYILLTSDALSTAEIIRCINDMVRAAKQGSINLKISLHRNGCRVSDNTHLSLQRLRIGWHTDPALRGSVEFLVSMLQDEILRDLARLTSSAESGAARQLKH